MDTNWGGDVNVSGDGKLSLRIPAEDRLEVGHGAGRVAEGGRSVVGVCFGDAIGIDLDGVCANEGVGGVLLANNIRLCKQLVVVDMAVDIANASGRKN